MPKVIGGFAALVALAAGILQNVEPITSVQRAALAFVLGAFLTQLWYVFFTVRVSYITKTEDDEDEMESTPVDQAPPAQAA